GKKTSSQFRMLRAENTPFALTAVIPRSPSRIRHYVCCGCRRCHVGGNGAKAKANGREGPASRGVRWGRRVGTAVGKGKEARTRARAGSHGVTTPEEVAARERARISRAAVPGRNSGGEPPTGRETRPVRCSLLAAEPQCPG